MRADIGNARNLQKALNRAVLAVFAVHHGENHVDALAHDTVVFKAQKALAAHGRNRRAAVFLAVLPRSGGQHPVILAAEQDPVAVLRDADRENVIFIFVQAVQHGFRRPQRDFMLRRNAAEQHTNAQFFQNRLLFSAAEDQKSGRHTYHMRNRRRTQVSFSGIACFCPRRL